MKQSATPVVKSGHPLIAGLVFALISMLLFTLVVSLLLYWTNWQESILSTASYTIHAAAAMLGGFVSGKKSGMRGWSNGALIGLLYFVIIFLIGFLSMDHSLSSAAFMLMGIMLAAGALGGIMGVNMNSSRK